MHDHGAGNRPERQHVPCADLVPPPPPQGKGDEAREEVRQQARVAAEEEVAQVQGVSEAQVLLVEHGALFELAGRHRVAGGLERGSRVLMREHPVEHLPVHGALGEVAALVVELARHRGVAREQAASHGRERHRQRRRASKPPAPTRQPARARPVTPQLPEQDRPDRSDVGRLGEGHAAKQRRRERVAAAATNRKRPAIRRRGAGGSALPCRARGSRRRRRPTG